MSGSGLRAIKDVAVLDHLRVTPELEAKLERAIQEAEKQGPLPAPKPPRTWLRPAGYAAVAAAVLVAALLAAPRPAGTVAGQPVPLPPPYQQAGSTTRTTATSYTVTVQDQAGNNVGGQAASSSPQSPQTATEAQPGRKIITNGEYGIRVTDASAAMARLEQEAVAGGGYVAEASLNKESDGSWSGRAVLRVPAEKAASTVALLGQIGTVERQRQWTQDVTDQYMDLQHRIEILKEHEARLRQLADKAATFDDWNKLAGQINATMVDVENLTGKLKLLANQVDYAILNIQVTQPAPGAVIAQKGATTIVGQMGEAFTNSLRTMGVYVQRLTVGMAALAPYLMIFLAVAAGLLVWHRRRQKKAEPNGSRS